jgi:hypothetical protein
VELVDGPDEEARDLPTGEAGMRLLVERFVQDTLRRSAGEDVRSTGESRRERGALWVASVRHQADAWQQGDGQAKEQVTTAVNQMTHLAQQATWFAEDEGLRSRAIAEVVARTTRGATVSSADAQQAWIATWEAQRDFGVGGSALPDPDVIRAAHGVHRDAEAAWLGLWEDWARRPPP